MKKFVLIFTLILMASFARAYDTEINGIYYDVVPKAKIATVVIGKEHYSGEVTIPETIEYEGVTCTVTSLSNAVFRECDVTKVWLPDGIKEINYTAFENCSNLEYVRLPAKLEKIGIRAFCNCSTLTSLDLPSSLKEIGNRAFWNCYALANITLPDNIETLEDGVFYNCNSITSIHIPKALTVIPKEAFLGCKFDVVEIHNGIRAIYDQAFTGTKIKSIVIPETVTELGSGVFAGCEDLVDVKLPDNMKAIPRSLFNGCKNLKEIQIPKGVTSIGEYAFSNTGFDNIEMIPEGITYLHYVFSKCKNLTTLTIPDGKLFGVGEFMDCENLHTVILPASVQFVNGSTFENCTALKEINFEYLTTISHWAFRGCTGLVSIDLPLVEELGVGVFIGCSGLKTISLGSHIKRFLGYSVFEKCENLEDFYCYAETPPEIPEGDRYTIFRDSYVEYATLHVPESAIEAYRSASPWKDFGKIVAIEGDGIEEVKASSSADSPYYSLSGIRTTHPKRGLYIKDGKKVIKK